MEVHPPHGSVHSVKDFMMHLLAITIGLLIALGLESSVEWIHHRHLAEQARENILREIHDNQRVVAREMNALPGERKQLEHILDVVSDVHNGRAAQPLGDLSWTNARLSEDAWNTSSSTGATSYMSYDEVKQYAQLYAVQRLFNASAERYLSTRGDMYASLTCMNRDKLSVSEYEQTRHAVASQIVIGQFLNEMGRALDARYAKVTGGSAEQSPSMGAAK